MSEYGIYRMEPDATMWDGKTGEIIELISPAQAALGVLTQEEIDAVVCLRAGFDEMGYYPVIDIWILYAGKEHRVESKTRAEALRLLAVEVGDNP